MRFFYFVLYTSLAYSLRIFYPRAKTIKNPEKYLGRTIYVSNHAASFMDPLIVAAKARPIVFFMTRSDVFTPLLKPILWAAHMLPIYREQDGVDTKNKNKEVFEKCAKVLKYGRNLLIFGEGFTDDVFVRRLKPIKKGAVRIGFTTLEILNWEKNIYISTVGINYGDPNVIGSELIVSYGEVICLNDYREAYLKTPNVVITKLTQQVEKDLQKQLTHVEEYEWVFFHEHVTRLTRIGIDPFDKDTSIPLLQRWENSKNFAKWIKQQHLEDPKLVQLKANLENYFQELKKRNISDTIVYEKVNQKQNIFLKWLTIVLFSPLSILGFIHGYVPYKFVKGFVEKTFKRRVFWSSVKMTLGKVALGIWNIPIVVLLHLFIFKPLLSDVCSSVWAFSLLYYVLTPLFGLSAYKSVRIFKNIRAHKTLKTQLNKLGQQRQTLLEEVLKLSFFERK